ncbi:unnamed protein product, partial [Ectocarpus sp. 12 AP-2014]
MGSRLIGNMPARPMITPTMNCNDADGTAFWYLALSVSRKPTISFGWDVCFSKTALLALPSEVFVPLQPFAPQEQPAVVPRRKRNSSPRTRGASPATSTARIADHPTPGLRQAPHCFQTPPPPPPRFPSKTVQALALAALAAVAAACTPVQTAPAPALPATAAMAVAAVAGYWTGRCGP